MLTQCLCHVAQGGCHEPEERPSHLRPLQAQVVSSPTSPVCMCMCMCTLISNGALCHDFLIGISLAHCNLQYSCSVLPDKRVMLLGGELH